MKLRFHYADGRTELHDVAEDGRFYFDQRIEPRAPRDSMTERIEWTRQVDFAIANPSYGDMGEARRRLFFLRRWNVPADFVGPLHDGDFFDFVEQELAQALAAREMDR